MTDEAKSEQTEQPESEAQNAQPEPIEEKQKPKMSKLAVLSIVCLVAALTIFVLYLRSGEAAIPLGLEKLILPLDVAILAIAFISAIVALVKIKAAAGALAGRRLALLGIIVPIIVAVAYVRSSLPAEETKESPSIRCRSNISRLAGEINKYRADNDGQFPKAEKWCDVLLEQIKVDESLFSCPLDKGARCSYSLNKYAVQAGADLPADIVLLFESAPGWNQVGGPELLTMPHSVRNRKGCNVVFANGKSRFVSEENVDTLRWKP
jgi:hypothetical protein